MPSIFILLLLLALPVNISAAKEGVPVIDCRRENGESEEQAEHILDSAVERFDRGMIRSLEQTLADVAEAFRTVDHPAILTEIQNILESGKINDGIQEFFDVCSKYLYTPTPKPNPN